MPPDRDRHILRRGWARPRLSNGAAGYIRNMRFAVGLSVIALGAILAFGVTSSPDAVNIQVIGVIFILVGLAGLALAQWLYTTRRRTDVIYHRDGVTLLEPNSPPPEGSVGAVETHGEPVAEREIDNLPPDGPAMPP